MRPADAGRERAAAKSASRSSRPRTRRSAYELRLADIRRRAWADPDLVKGILTNLLENAAEAAGEGGARAGRDRRRRTARWPSKSTIPARA